jgi:hypothetical protein
MTVYVDDMFKYAMGHRRMGKRMFKFSHMIADDEESLHAMARIIGVHERWYQGDHYDITMAKREAAIAAGAVPIELRTCAIMAGNRRAGWPMGTPDTCMKIAQQRAKQHYFLESIGFFKLYEKLERGK